MNRAQFPQRVLKWNWLRERSGGGSGSGSDGGVDGNGGTGSGVAGGSQGGRLSKVKFFVVRAWLAPSPPSWARVLGSILAVRSLVMDSQLSYEPC